MPRKFERPRKNITGLTNAIVWSLSNCKLGTQPRMEELYGFMDMFAPARAMEYAFWLAIDPVCNKANPEVMRILWEEFGEAVLKKWKQAGLPGLPAWSKKFDVDE